MPRRRRSSVKSAHLFSRCPEPARSPLSVRSSRLRRACLSSPKRLVVLHELVRTHLETPLVDCREGGEFVSPALRQRALLDLLRSESQRAHLAASHFARRKRPTVAIAQAMMLPKPAATDDQMAKTQFAPRARGSVRKVGLELLALAAALCISGCAASDNSDETGPAGRG